MKTKTEWAYVIMNDRGRFMDRFGDFTSMRDNALVVPSLVEAKRIVWAFGGKAVKVK